MEAPELIETPRDLEDALAELRHAQVLTVDTEFFWERTYDPLLCLVQVGARGTDGKLTGFAFDPLATDLQALFEFLGEPSRLKVFHAARIDLEILNQKLGRLLTPVYDTQKAAALLGFGAQVGYARLVEDLVGQKPEKGEQYSDWSKRPLRDAQIDYALADVVPLMKCYEQLEGLLARSGRRAWLDEELAPLTDPATYAQVQDDERYLKVKGARALDRTSLAVLRELAAWREQNARSRDLRPGFVVKDPALLGLARKQPRSKKELEQVRGLHGSLLKRNGDELVAAVRRGLDAEPPPSLRTKRPKVDVGASVDLLKTYLAQRSRELDVAQEILATSSELESLARRVAEGRDVDDCPLARGWRRELVGDEALRLLKGEVSLAVGESGQRIVLLERDG
ncbi:MAG: ribonuclease D [Planctomycetota bacterium]